MTFDHTDMEEFLGLTFVTKPTPTEVDTMCTSAVNLLTAKVGTLDDSQNDERYVLFLIVSQFLAKQAHYKSGMVGTFSTPAGSTTYIRAPQIWTEEVKNEVYAVYGVWVTDMPSAPSEFSFNDGGLTSDR